MLRKILISIIVVLILASIGAILYWYFYLNNTDSNIGEGSTNTSGEVFSPFDRSGNKSNNNNITPSATTTENKVEEEVVVQKIPKLRQLSIMPVSGISASSTASTSIARYIDRGTGHVYEAHSDSMEITKISNTVIPKTYDSYWNKNMNAFVTRYMKEDRDEIVNFYAELKSTGTSTAVTPYEIKGKFLQSSINQIAISPAKDRIFTWNIENGGGVGYINSFDEKNKQKIIDLPLREVSIDWPENNNVTITTKGLSNSSGYMYLISTKDGSINKILSGVKGITAKISKDLSKAVYSSAIEDGLNTLIYNAKDGTSIETLFKTLADKCVWSTKRKNELYCAVPTEIPQAKYPEDWYKGNISFVDQIWHLDTETGEVHLLANPISLSNSIIDAVKLNLDPDEDFLYFINKRDLTAWSLNLNE